MRYSSPEDQAHAYEDHAPPVQKKKSKLLLWIVGSLVLAGLMLCSAGILTSFGTDASNGVEPISTSTIPTPGSKPTYKTAPALPKSEVSTKGKPTPTAAKPKASATYPTLSERAWKRIAKSPDSYTGKTYTVYGVVTQFDSATGESVFRADVGHRRFAEDYEYPTNTMMSGSESALEDLVDGDEFRARVTVSGSFSYDTQIGGNTTVPLLRVESIKRF